MECLCEIGTGVSLWNALYSVPKTHAFFTFIYILTEITLHQSRFQNWHKLLQVVCKEISVRLIMEGVVNYVDSHIFPFF
jgi:hypothetical protein